MVNRAVLTMADDDTLLQQLQARLLGEELLDGLERFQQYGFTSVPHAGAEAIALSIGGNRSHTVIINVDDRRYRLKGLEGGEVALYTDEDQDEAGCRIVLKRGNRIELRGKVLDAEFTDLIRLATDGELELHAGQRREMDVAGYGDALNYEGGVWTTDSYHDGATFGDSTEHGIQPPEVD
jgi:phage baseplate assembly protein V